MSADVAARADALWRALTYLSVAQLHLCAYPLADSGELGPSQVKARPSGHWGTVPGIAWTLTHIGLAAGRNPELEIVPLIGAGHAGVVQRALAWLTGDLARLNTRFTRCPKGLTSLVETFPDLDDLGSEVHPALPAGSYLGGWLGGVFPFAQGMALDAPDRVTIPVIGDGECETPATAASWLAHHSLVKARVLPVIHLNGYRMGGPSVLSQLSDERLLAYVRGLGWTPIVAAVGSGALSDHASFHELLQASITGAHNDERRVILLRCQKGWSGPLGAHKTPLTDVAHNSHQRSRLREWLLSYRPDELFDEAAQPIGLLARALEASHYSRPHLSELASPTPPAPRGRGFSIELSAVLRAHAAVGGFKLFCPDELASNRLGALAEEPWAHEILAEEVLLGWLAGWTATGRRGVLFSYEAFAPLMLTGLIGHLKQRRLQHDDTLPSINLVLTSYGWHNVYTHGDPSLVTALVGTNDPAVHVFTPADADRAALSLDDALRTTGRVNVIVVGKHCSATYPRDSIDTERRSGLARWEHLSDADEPDLVLVCAGDLAAAAVSEALPLIRTRHSCRVRVVNVHELTALAGAEIHRHVGERAAVVVATLGHPAAIWGLLAGRVKRLNVVGWREPPHPMPQDRLAQYSGLDAGGISRAADHLLCSRIDSA